jgi:hypothetical protein
VAYYRQALKIMMITTITISLIIMMIIIQLFIYLSADLNSQWPATESARIQTAAVRRHRTKHTHTHTHKRRKTDQLRIFIFEHEFIKISAGLQTAFAAETRPAEGQCLEEHVNVPSRNPKADCFEDRGATFRATRDIY